VGPLRLSKASWTGLLLGCLTIPSALGWSDHASLVWPLLRQQPELVEQTVAAEPLEQFLQAEAEGVAQALQQVEAWSRATIEHYPQTPDALRWRLDTTPTVTAFLGAIRVNPLLPYRLYVDLSPEQPTPEKSPLAWAELSFLGGGSSQLAARYWLLEVGEPVSIAEVIASASDEPDFGMDIGLFEDNNTDFGRRYGFGTQPFGNPNLDYGSQAPFHMGFYHLDWLARTAQPDLLRTYPLWRIALFGELADLAFRTGHAYWGWRFLGWGLHYVGDLTQPYHAVPLPGVDTLDALWSAALGKTGEMVQLVSNRHGVIESYQYQRLTKALNAGDWNAPLVRAVSDHAGDEALDYDTFVMALTADSAAAAGDFDAAIEASVSPRFVSDPSFEWTGSGFESEIVTVVEMEQGAAALDSLDAAVVVQLERFSAVASRWIARGHRAAATSN
jgi:hypothetical protein